MSTQSCVTNVVASAHIAPRASLRHLPRLDEVLYLTCCTHNALLLREEAALSRPVTLVIGLLATSARIYVRAYSRMGPAEWIQAHADLLADVGGLPTRVQTDVWDYGFERAGDAPVPRQDYAAFARLHDIVVDSPANCSANITSRLAAMRQALQRQLAAVIDEQPRTTVEELNRSLKRQFDEYNAQLVPLRLKHLRRRVTTALQA